MTHIDLALSEELAVYWAWIASLVPLLFPRRAGPDKESSERERNEYGVRNAGYSLLVLLVLPLCFTGGVRIVTRIRDWTSEATLFEAAMRVCPLSVKTLANHALLQHSQGEGHSAVLASEW